MSSSNASSIVSRSATTLTILATTVLLAGCSTLGFGGADSTVTNSTGQSGMARWGQSMPAVQVAADERYLPPANIANAPANPGLINPATAMPVASAPVMSGQVSQQELPALTAPSVTSAPQMSAQVAAAPANIAMPNAPAAPQLGVVTGDTYHHTIVSGESLYTIARRYDVSAQDIINANGISAPDSLRVGQQLVIPGRADLLAGMGQQPASSPVANNGVQPLGAPANDSAGQQPASPPPAAQPAPTQQAAAPATQPAAPAASSGSDQFRWPLSGRVIADFSSNRTGINIEATEGTAIRAAEAGEVIYVGNAVEGYGNLVLIRHSNGFVSAYAHLRDINVTRGAQVGRGDTIGTVGMTGSVTRPQLHFELRRGATPIDPMPLLAG